MTRCSPIENLELARAAADMAINGVHGKIVEFEGAAVARQHL